MKNILLFFCLSISHVLFSQSDWNASYYTVWGSKVLEFHSLQDHSYLSFDNWDCTSLTINQIKDRKVIAQYFYPDEALQQRVFHRKNDKFLLVGTFSAHDYGPVVGSSFIHSDNYTKPQAIIPNDYLYQDFSFISDTTIIAIAFRNMKEKKEIDEWQILDLNGKVIKTFSPTIKNTSEIIFNNNRYTVGTDDSLYFLDGNFNLLSKTSFPKYELFSLDAIGDSLIGAFLIRKQEIQLYNLFSFDKVATENAKYIYSNHGDELQFLDLQDQIQRLTYKDGKVLKENLLNASLPDYEARFFAHHEDQYTIVGTDVQKYGLTEYRHFAIGQDKEVLYDVGIRLDSSLITTKFDTMILGNGQVVSIPRRTFSGTYSLINKSSEDLLINVRTQGLGGAFCFNFDQSWAKMILANSEESFPFTFSPYYSNGELCLIAYAADNKTDSDYFDNNVCMKITAVKDINSKNHVSLHPNPTADILHIQSDNSFMSCAIYNQLGKEILQANTSTIDVSSLSCGIYFVKIEYDKNSVWRQFVKI